MRYFFFFYIISFSLSAQIKGRITDEQGVPVAFASVLVENTKWSTMANEYGDYFIGIPNSGTYSLVVQQLGYESKRMILEVNAIPYQRDITLKALDEVLEEMYIEYESSQDRAQRIMKSASKYRNYNAEKVAKYEIDFYSKGAIQVIDYPEQFLGYKIDQLDPTLKIDSLKNKYIYLSETFSKISISKPDQYKERVTAAKVSGNDNGYGFNSGLTANFDFYKNEVISRWKLISPLAPVAPSYYQFDLKEVFTDNITDKQIYKIEVTPRRSSEPLVKGYIYVVDDSWEIYAVDVIILGKNVQIPQVDQFHVRQNFTFNSKYDGWFKSSQKLDFNGTIIVFKFLGSFNYVYSNFVEKESFSKDTFSNEVITYEKDSNKLSNRFWEEKRPIPLTRLELRDYTENDRKLLEQSSHVYQDSIDRVNNKFNLFKLVLGYRYRKSKSNLTYTYNGLLSTFAFNPVQGFNVTTGLWVTKENPNKNSYFSVGGLVNYGIAENKPRLSVFYTHLFNRVNYAKLHVTGGSTVHQFGEDFPIKKIVNSLSASWFGKNFAKFYHRDFIRAQYEQEVYNGLFAMVDLEYANRKPLFNNVQHSPFVPSRYFSSNNPVDPNDFENPGFLSNQIIKLRFNTTINFDQKYIRYPEKKVNFVNSKYPLINLSYEKGMFSSVNSYNYDLIGASVKYSASLGSSGNTAAYLNGGLFLNADDIAFMDYKHFYGNETFIGTTKNYLQNFNLLPYYSHSTNRSFIEFHAEHNFKGYLLNKIPLIDRLQWHVIAGFHALYIVDRNPYHEFTIGLDNFGFGKFRPFRIDYVHSFGGGYKTNGVVIGIKLLDALLQ